MNRSYLLLLIISLSLLNGCEQPVVSRYLPLSNYLLKEREHIIQKIVQEKFIRDEGTISISHYVNFTNSSLPCKLEKFFMNIAPGEELSAEKFNKITQDELIKILKTRFPELKDPHKKLSLKNSNDILYHREVIVWDCQGINFIIEKCTILIKGINFSCFIGIDWPVEKIDDHKKSLQSL